MNGESRGSGSPFFTVTGSNTRSAAAPMRVQRRLSHTLLHPLSMCASRAMRPALNARTLMMTTSPALRDKHPAPPSFAVFGACARPHARARCLAPENRQHSRQAPQQMTAPTQTAPSLPRAVNAARISAYGAPQQRDCLTLWFSGPSERRRPIAAPATAPATTLATTPVAATPGRVYTSASMAAG